MKIFNKRYYRKTIIYFLTWCLTLNTTLPVVMALESGDLLSSSDATFTQWGDHTIIDTDHGAIIDWSNFNTSDTQSVTFNQYLNSELSSSSAVLNRISSGSVPTAFNGALNANGRVFIVNPAGILFGADSTVNVTQLVASGLNMSNEAFDAVLADPANQMVFQGGNGEVQNLGEIQADSVYLIGKKVLNIGSIVAPEGLVVMAAGDSVFLAQDGSNVFVEVEADPLDPSADVSNEGLISAENGSIVLAAGDTFSRAIANIGTLAAPAGTITAHAARIENSGTINADAVDADEGIISLTVSEGIVLKEGGTTTANDGKLLIDAPELAIADGYILAEPQDNTLYEKWIEEQSQAGTDLELVAHSSKHGNIFVENISDGEITGGSGDIALRTTYNTGGITFMPEIDGGPVTTTIHTTNGGSVYMLAGEGGITIGDVITEVPSDDKVAEPGKIRLFTNNYGDIETGQLTVRGGSYDEVSVIASGDLTINGNVETLTNQVPSDTKEVGQAKTCLVSVYGDVQVDGAITVKAHGKYYSTADIHICAGENVTVNLGQEQQIEATTHTSENGPAEASVLIHAGKDMEEPGIISINGGGTKPIHVYAKAGKGEGTAEVYSVDDPADWDETDGDAHAVLEIDEHRTLECPDCPMPPDLPPPIPPMPMPDEATTHMGKSVSINVLENDTPSENGDLTAIIVGDPEHGEIVEFDLETGEFTYQPDEGFVGKDTFTYVAVDGDQYTEPVTVTITVTNVLPDLANDTVNTHMGDSVSNIDVLANDSDPDGDTFTIDFFVYEGEGTLIQNEDGTFTYIPPEGFVGVDSFTYTTSDGQDGVSSESATGYITITNTLPAAEGEELTTHMGVPVDGTIQDNISDLDGDPLSTSLVTDTEHGKLTLNPDGSYSYEPESGYVGPDSFTFSASDGEVGAETTEATVTISMTNIPPTLGDDAAATDQDVAVNIDVLANDFDADGDSLTINTFNYEGSGTLILNEDGTFTYIPGKGFAGEDSFLYSAADPAVGGEISQAKVTITVIPEPVPVAPLYTSVAPGLEKLELEVSGCPALMAWVAKELGVNERMMDIWVVNSLASTRDIQPCDMCARLKEVAAILQDNEGTHITALAMVVNEFASSIAPPTEEQMASIANAIASNTETDSHYAVAGKYLDALAAYVGVLNNEMNFSIEQSITFAADKYISLLAESEDVGLTAYVAARLADLGG